jgi:hypothetical protein
LKNIVLSFALLSGCLAPLCARAAAVDPTSFPDGTYTATVEHVVDAKHVEVVMDGKETTLEAGRASVDFSKVQTNDQIKLSLIKGTVVVYADLTSH